ncbi:hypothetical protein HMI55_003476 [Coelomomyces lativittatus]|nr:hypothetical protein HMI55_003476 [Coelomomyces lativittatus]
MNSPSLETLHHRARKLHNTFDNIMKTLPDDTKGSLKSVKSQNLNQIALIEAQAEVFEIEKELDKARERYTNLKKKRYTEPS